MATFDFEGGAITVAPSQTLELGELAFMQEQFGVEGLVDLERGMAHMEPAAWRAILIVSVRRIHPGVALDHEAIDAVAVLPRIGKLNEERAAAAEGGDRPTARKSRARSGTSG